MKYLLLLPLVALTACGTTGGDSSTKPYDWPKSTGKVKISNSVTLGSKDYQLKTVDGSGLSGDGGQQENQEPPFIMNSGARLKRAIADSWPESIHVEGGNVIIEDVYIPDVGEDAISTRKNKSIKKLTIRNCAFAKATDKIIQINEGAGDVLIENCHFDGFKSAIRLKEGVRNVTIKNCHFQNGSGAIVLDPGVSKPKIENCTYTNVDHPLRQD